MPEITPRSIPASAVQHLLDNGYASALARIFAARGITDSSQLDTSLAGLLPFDSLKNAREMARLLADAIAARKKILVIADYDADGATACAVAVRGLRSFGAQIDFIVPNRFEYGYGLTPEIVHLAAKRRPDILLTVDNGIASVEGVAEANRLGMQVFVTDHHLPGDTLPDAACIVNPNQPGCAFPGKHLAGVGVMFYVLLALRAELRTRGAFDGSSRPRPSPPPPPPPRRRERGAKARRTARPGRTGNSRRCGEAGSEQPYPRATGPATHARRARLCGHQCAVANGGEKSEENFQPGLGLHRRAAPECGGQAGRHEPGHRLPAGRRRRDRITNRSKTGCTEPRAAQHRNGHAGQRAGGSGSN